MPEYEKEYLLFLYCSCTPILLFNLWNLNIFYKVIKNSMLLFSSYLYAIKYFSTKKKILIKILCDVNNPGFCLITILLSLKQGPVFIAVLSLNNPVSQNSLQKFNGWKNLHFLVFSLGFFHFSFITRIVIGFFKAVPTWLSSSAKVTSNDCYLVMYTKCFPLRDTVSSKFLSDTFNFKVLSISFPWRKGTKMHVFLDLWHECFPKLLLLYNALYFHSTLWPSVFHQCSREVSFFLSKLHSAGKFKLDIPLQFAIQVSICTSASSDFNHQGGAVTFTSNPSFYLSTHNPPPFPKVSPVVRGY